MKGGKAGGGRKGGKAGGEGLGRLCGREGNGREERQEVEEREGKGRETNIHKSTFFFFTATLHIINFASVFRGQTSNL